MLVRDTASGVTESQDSIMSTKQSPNLLLLGPVTGASALATFRALQNADLPGGGGSASAYFPEFWGIKAVNGGGGITTTSTSLLNLAGISTVGTISAIAANATKAVRMQWATSSVAGNSSGFCEFAASQSIASPMVRTLGTTKVLLANITLQQTTNMRFWFGMTDISPNQMNPTFAVTAATAGSGNTVYTGSGFTAGQFVGQYMAVTGFVNSNNNGGPWLCTANTTTTITLSNPSGGTNETHAGTVNYGVAVNFRTDTPPTNFVGFRFSTSAGDAKYQLVCQTSAANQTVTPESGSHTVNTTDELQLAFGYNSITGAVDFYIGLDYVGSISTNVPSTSLLMQSLVALDNVGTANAQSFQISQLKGQ